MANNKRWVQNPKLAQFDKFSIPVTDSRDNNDYQITQAELTQVVNAANVTAGALKAGAKIGGEDIATTNKTLKVPKSLNYNCNWDTDLEPGEYFIDPYWWSKYSGNLPKTEDARSSGNLTVYGGEKGAINTYSIQVYKETATWRSDVGSQKRTGRIQYRVKTGKWTEWKETATTDGMVKKVGDDTIAVRPNKYNKIDFDMTAVSENLWMGFYAPEWLKSVVFGKDKYGSLEVRAKNFLLDGHQVASNEGYKATTKLVKINFTKELNSDLSNGIIAITARGTTCLLGVTNSNYAASAIDLLVAKSNGTPWHKIQKVYYKAGMEHIIIDISIADIMSVSILAQSSNSLNIKNIESLPEETDLSSYSELNITAPATTLQTYNEGITREV